MDAKTFIKSYAAAWLASKTRQSLKRTGQEVARRLARKGHEILYFHRSDDPYCQLMVQVIPDLMRRFNVSVKPLVVERLPAVMYPDPARYEAYSIIDAMRLARLYGLGFPETATVPDRLGVGMANRYLASMQDDPAFFVIAEEIGAALWRQDISSIMRVCVIADMHDERLIANERLLIRLGHYASGTLYYGGEFYPGLDRLDHLERRLNRLDCGDGEVHFELTRLWRYGLEEMGHVSSGKTVELFFSVRSPYSYIALTLAKELVERTGVHLKLRPVLPMVMRGYRVPRMKASYIFEDAAREARAEGIPFGHIVDPLGFASERAMAMGLALADEKKDIDFFLTFMKAVWAQGVDAASDKGFARIMKTAGVDPREQTRALSDDIWRAKAEKNRQDMLMYGSWGVPTFRVGTSTLWGQDRMWEVVRGLRHSSLSHDV